MSYELKCTLLTFIVVFCCNYIASAAAYPWQADHEGYDASLDPVIWSRAFVKDNIRRPRQFATFPAAAGGNNEVQLNNRFYEFQQRFVDSNRAASGILRDEKRRAKSSAHFGEGRTGASAAESEWNAIAHAEYRSGNNRKSSLNRSKTQARRKRNHKR
ncbi:uncharacterized protein LOC126757156 [Bactrocera neohumeralis]|uniref:uncharacterized protein LOC126757156 n=1 Tax=Bactrocera neohumeralis TaxID=98809 RepID=UPI00216516B2|nr:uncharacterized protein LOC126757156 [Bactrocera neohumeralis]